MTFTLVSVPSGVASTRPGAAAPLAGTAAARFHLAPKRAAHHMTGARPDAEGQAYSPFDQLGAAKDASYRLLSPGRREFSEAPL
jgi:hypothetical protein